MKGQNMSQYSAGAAFRKAVQEESPLQVVGAINANHALLAKRADHLQRGFFLNSFAEGGACGILTHVVTFQYCIEVAMLLQGACHPIL